MRNITKRTSVIAAAMVVVLFSAVAAYAYWTSTGTGTGTAATGTSSAVNAVQTSVISNMGPGVAAQTLSGTFDNTDTDPLYVTSLSVSISSITVGGVAAVGCEADDYVITGSPLAIGAQANPDDTTAWSGPTIAFVNEAGENQDGCKNATVNLAYAVA